MDLMNPASYDEYHLQAHPGLKAVVTTGMLEGLPVRIVDHGRNLKAGDTYIAERNSGVKLLTCRENDIANGWVMPVERAYSFDTGECFKIEFVEDGS